jgi:hypothetical protein
MVKIRRGNGYEPDARTEKPKHDGGSARMIGGGYEQHSLHSTPRQLRPQSDGFLNGGLGIVTVALE